MQWEFTPEEVVKGEVDYGLEAFRRDLFEEIAANLGSDDETFLQQSFDVIYDLCYWETTGREAHLLQAIKEHMRDNITMLGAILQRMIMDGVEQGMPIEQALAQAAQRHSQVAEG